MRIYFTNISIPTRAAKRLKELLGIKESESRRATALVLGYRNWTDLHKECPAVTPTPLDEACDVGALEERRHSQVLKLRESGVALGNRTAEELVAAWQPSAGRPQIDNSRRIADKADKRSNEADFLAALHAIEDSPQQKVADSLTVLLAGILQTSNEVALERAREIAFEMLSGERTPEPGVARKLLEAVAARGEPTAIYNLSMSLTRGDDGPADDKRATDLLETLVNNEKAPTDLKARARSRLGNVYSEGKYRAKNLKIALSLWEQAAQGGDVAAAFNAGLAYEVGRGVVPNPEKAVEYLRLAAEGGSVKASTNLGLILLTRTDLSIAVREAEFRLEFAAKRGDTNAVGALKALNEMEARALKDLDEGTMSPEEIVAVQKMMEDMARGVPIKEVFKAHASPPVDGPRRSRTRKTHQS